MTSDDEREHRRLLRYDEQAGAYRTASVKFSQLAVTNLILINAGGLLALANGVFSARVATMATATQAGVWFVAGLVLAIGTAYATYLNFGLHASQQATLRSAEDWQQAKRRLTALAIEQSTPFDQKGFLSDGRSLSEFAEECDRVENEQKTAAGRANFWINFTFGAGQVFGLSSMVCFVAGCFVLVAGGIATQP